ncbi:cytidine deaminase [Lonsdalea quercina]|uniref:cytidine deaminase n=1 Tax=Lonsdalea quercina TaxID=71657 RepID=UPI003975C229
MQPRFHAALSQLPDAMQAVITPMLNRGDFAAWLSAADVGRLCLAGQVDEAQLALMLLPLAAACAHAPISRFQVGAVAQGASGNLYFGANMEFPGMPLQQSVHAEQSAITHAWLRHERALRTLTVNYSPCGHCRQFINELNSASTLSISLPERTPQPLSHYLPDAFGPRDLNVATLLMDPVHHGLSLYSEDTLVQAALAAANRSHAPYTEAYSGIALQTYSGTIYIGCYAENAAFNPSLPPLQAALNLMNLSGERFGDLRHAVLVERQQAATSQRSATQAMLGALGDVDLRYVVIA